MYITLLWLIAAVVFVAVEAATYQMLTIWFAIGSVVCALLSALGLDIAWQIVAFFVVSACCLAALRPLSLKALKNRKLKSGPDSFVDEEVLVTEDVDNTLGKGKALLNGMEWTVRSADSCVITSGTKARVEKVCGVKLIIKTKGDN